MAENMPVSPNDGPAEHGTAQGTGAVSGTTAQQIDPAALGAAFPRTHHVLLLEFGDRKDFDNPRQEWRRLFSELLGTFALVLAAAGGGLLHAKGQISLAAAVVAPGLTVTAIILFMGAISGAHLNPAVSLAFAPLRNSPWKRVPGYIVIQLVGATLACLFLRLVFGNIEHLGATLPGPGYKNWQALLMEIVLTALLVSVILGTASAAQNVGAIAALGVGAYIALAGLWAAPVSGVSMNPARSFGPALVSGDFTSYWVYIVGPTPRPDRRRLRDRPSWPRRRRHLARGGLRRPRPGRPHRQGQTVPGHRPRQGRPRGNHRHRYAAERTMTSAALKSRDDDWPDRPSLTPSHSKTPVSPGPPTHRPHAATTAQCGRSQRDLGHCVGGPAGRAACRIAVGSYSAGCCCGPRRPVRARSWPCCPGDVGPDPPAPDRWPSCCGAESCSGTGQAVRWLISSAFSRADQSGHEQGGPPGRAQRPCLAAALAGR